MSISSPSVTLRRACASAASVTALVVVLAGCGGSGSGASVGGQVVNGRGDSATFQLGGGQVVSVTQSGTVTLKESNAPQLNYSGAVGCAGRFFTADYAGANLYFHYGSRDAYLLVGSDLYYLGGAPERKNGSLVWNTTVDGQQILITAACPRPPATGYIAKADVPIACNVLTPSIAAATLRRRVSAAKYLQENPDLTYCKYTTVDQSFDNERTVSVSVATPDVLASLSSWAQPRIAGVGDEAHGGTPDLGLAARKGKLGVEVTVDLGVHAGDAASLAAEKALAQQLLATLPG